MGTAADRTSVWLASKPAAPSRRRSELPAGLDRERITTAAVRLLDTEGLAGFSMRRLAGRLGVTAMSLYWYVDTKDDLLELALDAALGEFPLPPENAGHWSDRLRALACGHRRLLAAHPWLPALSAEYPNIGPHARAFDSALMRVLAATGLTAPARTGAHLAVSRFLHGCGTARQAPEGDFHFALDVLVAGIEAHAAPAVP
ncbi:TetR/AcrR family transcriptional regulator [Streptomyces sp. NRRL S-87]|uniref:TetR/AcrR family transcriptional regulator n=1 Tax=Streptomyces sp. NRRL S-87 TaxID=1463920 RepID=UPI0004C0F51C|nr:TetR/AcrR family transcriptional regulator C-terminal domain-containing protein [Streptomyces sp. NRRL S-87]